jgi:DNA helicase HerA-like ATPase
VTETATPTSGMERRLEAFRAVRETIEASILPLATSVDGRTFTFQASLHALELRAGGYVVLEDARGSRLGQILSLELAVEEATALEQPAASAEGATTRSRVLARLARGVGAILDGDGAPFHDARARPATPSVVRTWLAGTSGAQASLEVGHLALASGVAYALNAGGFGRHTFLCGQSGSGKTYSLGVVLERLLLETTLRIVILDPNSDYVRLADVRPGVEAGTSGRYEEVARGVVVQRELRLSVDDLDADEQAAVLRLDPIADREEYAELAAIVAEQRPGSLRDLRSSEREQARRLALRAANLGVDRWTLWSEPGADSLLDDLARPDARCVVVDLGSLATRAEQALAAGAVLRALWRTRARREPVLIVIDEAHNVCPQVPEDGLIALAAEDAIRIAGEGRKFGLYLLLATQRPDKLHTNVLSQCDNLLLMRMNSEADLAVVGEVFSFVPPGLLEGATAFRQGEALAAGKISSHPALIRFGERISEEGGADVPATWADR